MRNSLANTAKQPNSYYDIQKYLYLFVMHKAYLFILLKLKLNTGN